MKARVKATGKLLENVIPIMSVDGKVIMFHEYGTENDYYYYEDLDFSNTIDWEQSRIQFVGQIASAIMSNYEFYAHAIAEECKKSGKSRPEMVAQMSVEIADALVEELMKGGQDE